MLGPPPHAHVHPVHSLVALKFNHSDYRHSDDQVTQRGYSLTVSKCAEKCGDVTTKGKEEEESKRELETKEM